MKLWSAIQRIYRDREGKKPVISKFYGIVRVKEVKPLPSYNVLISFVTGERKRYNVAPLFEKWDAFKTLSSVKGLFEQVKVDAGGYGISWNDDIDLSCNELWENGVAVETEEQEE